MTDKLQDTSAFLIIDGWTTCSLPVDVLQLQSLVGRSPHRLPTADCRLLTSLRLLALCFKLKPVETQMVDLHGVDNSVAQCSSNSRKAYDPAGNRLGYNCLTCSLFFVNFF